MLRDLFDDIDYEVEMKTFDEYEEEAMNTAVYDDDLIYPLIGLVSEAGEVADKFKEVRSLVKAQRLICFHNQLTSSQAHYLLLEI